MPFDFAAKTMPLGSYGPEGGTCTDRDLLSKSYGVSLREGAKLIREKGLVSVRSQQLGYFICITVKFKPPIGEQEKCKDYRHNYKNFPGS